MSYVEEDAEESIWTWDRCRRKLRYEDLYNHLNI